MFFIESERRWRTVVVRERSFESEHEPTSWLLPLSGNLSR